MDIDIHTLTVVATLLQLSSLCTMGLLHYLRFTKARTTRTWLLSGACMSVGTLLFALRPLLPLVLSVIAGNMLVLLGILQLWQGMRLFLERKPFSLALQLSPLLLAPVFYWFTAEQDLIVVRIYTFYLAAAVIFLGMGWELLAGSDASRERGRILLGICFGGYGVSYLLFLLLVDHAQRGSFFQTGLSTYLTLLLECLFLLLYTAGVIMLVCERLQQQLYASRQQAESASKAKTDFLENMSHELLPSVTAVQRMLDTTLQSEMSAEQRENLLTARHAAQQLAAIAGDLQDISRIEAGEIRIEEMDFDFQHLLQTLTLSLAPVAAAKGIELEIGNAPEELRYLKGDPQRVRQVLANLLELCISLMDCGGLSLLVLPPDVSASRDSSLLRLNILIQDSDAGLSPEIREALSRELDQAGRGGAVSGEGLGLNLALSHRLARLMHGDLQLEETFMAGISFNLSLGLAAGTPEAAHAFLGSEKQAGHAGMAQNAPLVQEQHTQTMEHNEAEDSTAESPPLTAPQQAAATNASRLLDRAELLQRMAGDEDLAWQLYRFFVQQAFSTLQQLEASLALEDFELLRTRAHTLKGEAANAGAHLVREAALQLEQAARKSEMDAARQALDSLTARMEETVQHIRHLAETENLPLD